MNINNLIAIVKKKIESQITLDKIEVVDKSFLHKNHPGNDKAKFHLKIYIKSQELKKLNQIERSRIIYKILNKEMKEFIHSLQILIN